MVPCSCALIWKLGQFKLLIPLRVMARLQGVTIRERKQAFARVDVATHFR